MLSMAAHETVDEADAEVGKLDPQVPEGQILPLATKLINNC